jgi:hypothetical protein
MDYWKRRRRNRIIGLSITVFIFIILIYLLMVHCSAHPKYIRMTAKEFLFKNPSYTFKYEGNDWYDKNTPLEILSKDLEDKKTIGIFMINGVEYEILLSSNIQQIGNTGIEVYIDQWSSEITFRMKGDH